MKTRLIQRAYDVLLLALFMAVVMFPLAKGIVTPDAEWSDVEKRELQKFPELPDGIFALHKFFREFEEYYNDHFGYREKLIYRYQRELEKRFGIAGTPLVLKGEGKWLFFTADNLLDDYLGKIPLSREELDEWYEEQQWRHQWLQQRGVAYLTFCPPNKQTVYPEKMPEEYRDAGGVTRMQQLHHYLEERPQDFYINLHDVVIGAKDERKLYFAMDTHWNHYGAYVAFKEVMARIEELFPQHSYITEFAFHTHYRRSLGGDLAKMLMIEKQMSETMPKVRPREYCAEKVEFDIVLTNVGTRGHEKPLLKRCPEKTLRAVVFSDSFIDRFEPFFSENFGEVLYLRKSYDHENVRQLLETFRPDIIIDERVERNFFRRFSVTRDR